MSLQQVFRVKSLDPQKGPRRRLTMTSLGSADYDTSQRYFQPCLKKILKKMAVVQFPILKTYCNQRATPFKTVPLLLQDLKLRKFTAASIMQNCECV